MRVARKTKHKREAKKTIKPVLTGFMGKSNVGRIQIGIGDSKRVDAADSSSGIAVGTQTTPRFDRVMAVDHISAGQKVLVYVPGQYDVVSAEGIRIGPKRHIQGTGYVDEENGRLVVLSEALGKLKIISPNTSKAYSKKKEYNGIPMITVTDE